MIKQKPVWRMNSGNKNPKDRKKSAGVLFNNGKISMEIHGSEWDFEEENTDYSVSFYQTNRAKAAKYEQKHCWPCDGRGHLRYRGLDTCPHCNGKGYKMEKIK